MEPLSHQIEAAKILGARSILADKRGLGKTLSSLLWAKEARRLLVIAPKEVVENFLEEIELWFPDRKPISLIGKSASERDAYLRLCSVLDSFCIVLNLEAWRKDRTLVQRLVELRFDTVIIDEAHNLNNIRTKAFKGVNELLSTPNQCELCGSTVFKLKTGYFCLSCHHLSNGSNSVQNVQLLTGTPLLNKPADLMPILWLTHRDFFPPSKRKSPDDALKWYLNAYCYKTHDGRWKFYAGSEQEILEFLGTNYLSRNRDDAGIVLPPQKVQYYHLDFTEEEYPKQWELYRQLREAAAIKIAEDATIDIISMIALITRLRQAIVWPAGMEINGWKCDVEESVKIDAMEKLGNELVEEGERVVVFSQFKPPLHELQKRFGDKAIVLDGSTSPKVRTEIRHDFDRRYSKNRWQILLANYKVAGESLNFNAATVGVALDRQWNPGREEQSQGRLDRMGQTEETTYYILRASPSIDDWHARLMTTKRKMNESWEEAARETLKEYLLS